MNLFTSKFPAFAILIALLAIPLTLSDVRAAPILGSAWTSAPPTIDGILSLGEWNSAGSEVFTMGGRPVTIYMMNDANNLYVAVKIEDDDALDDDLTVQFDNDNGGGTLVQGDDSLTWWGDFLDTYFEPPTATEQDENDGGAKDGSGAKTQDVLMVAYYEFSHPLDSADDSHDFSLQIGSTVGFELLWKDRTPEQPSSFYSWPAVTWTDANNYGDAVIASPPARMPVGGVVAPTNKLALATPFLALAGLIVAVSAVVVVKKRSKN
jgi:hypothetical protein